MSFLKSCWPCCTTQVSRIDLRSQASPAEHITFLLDQRIIDLLASLFPRGVATLIARHALQNTDDFIFGPGQWKAHWNATPVTLPPLEDLQKSVAASGKATPKPIEQMKAEECANLLGMRGVEEHPEPSKELLEQLASPLRKGERAACFTCAVTYIPQYVLRDGKILAVSARTLALELASHPKQGKACKLFASPHSLDSFLTPKDAGDSETSCYFVMEREVDPASLDEDGHILKIACPSLLMTQIQQQWKGEWDLPEPRNFMATVFSRCVWKSEHLFAALPRMSVFARPKSRDGRFLTLANSQDKGILIDDMYDVGSDSRSAVLARKFPTEAAKNP